MAVNSGSLSAALGGLVAVYKPADVSLTALKRILGRRIAVQANAAVGWPRLPSVEMPVVREHKSGALVVVGKRKQLDYSQHPLVCGETYRHEDIRIQELLHMETSSSGVCVFGINEGIESLDELRSQQWMNRWRLEGVLGRETLKHEIKAKVTRREPYDHVSKQKLTKLFTRMRSDWRRIAFESAEVDLQSSEAYALATRGLPRPKLPGAQVVVDLKLAFFRLPYFAVMSETIGETDAYLRCLINEIGVNLGTTASPVRVIRRSLGPFFAEHCLLERQLSLQNIVDNVAMCRRTLKDFKYDPGVVNEPSKDTSSKGIQARKELWERMAQHELPPEEFDAMKPAWPRDYAA